MAWPVLVATTSETLFKDPFEREGSKLDLCKNNYYKKKIMYSQW